jgi:citrate lyase subunit beta / citryl-CoA lyase
MLSKARGILVDEVVIDLEDAVATEAKVRAREAACAALADGFTAGALAVRINASSTPWAADDLIAVANAAPALRTVVVPKVESAADLAFVDTVLGSLGSGGAAGVRVQALIETPRALHALDEIAHASSRLEALILGYADMAAGLGRSRAGAANLDLWLPIQDAVLTAARAAGLQAIDGPFLSIDDEAGLRATTRRAVALGFDGKWAIHPAQLKIVTDEFTPDADEVARARAIVLAVEQGAATSQGAVRHDGEMLDEAVCLAARRTLARAAEVGR